MRQHLNGRSFQFDNGVDEIELLAIGQHVVTVGRHVGDGQIIVSIKISVLGYQPKTLREITVYLLLSGNTILVRDVGLGQNNAHTVHIITDTFEIITGIGKKNIVYQMLVDGILSVHLLDGGLGKWVSHFHHVLAVLFKIDDTLTRRQTFSVSKKCPVIAWNIKAISFCNGYQPRALRLLRCSSRALLVISILFSGYPNLEHSNMASAAICLTPCFKLCTYRRAFCPFLKESIDNRSSIIPHNGFDYGAKLSDSFEITQYY